MSTDKSSPRPREAVSVSYCVPSSRRTFFGTNVKAGEPNVLKELGHCGGQLSVVVVVVMVVGGNLVTVEVEDGVK